jgi:hypothetical protein
LTALARIAEIHASIIRRLSNLEAADDRSDEADVV